MIAGMTAALRNVQAKKSFSTDTLRGGPAPAPLAASKFRKELVHVHSEGAVILDLGCYGIVDILIGQA
jgi:hypothetical protein